MMDQDNIQMEKPLINRVANSGLININLEDYFPSDPLAVFDLKDYLFQGLILKEKDYRAALKAHDWQQYADKVLLVFCSADAIIPSWAFMLVAGYAEPYIKDLFYGNQEQYLSDRYKHILADLDFAQYEEKRIVIKGCSNKPVPAAAYMELTRLLRPYAQSIMYGEPCSTVPIFKRPRNLNK